ncbi:hypothetical protein QTP70_016711 [Hemibagrus guttatus]|uniref:Uncharacterized protein n=1 Tax=Hemibagrus guttatus TaxID=175788 RepID=A0AAE0R817_9TELE|nr:hypothetical protein QTP70_016711 [Hemibagrus guttatus]
MTSTAEQQDQATSTAEQQLRATSTAEHSHRATSTDERRLRGDDVRLAGVWNSPRGGRAGAGCCRNSPPLATDTTASARISACLADISWMTTYQLNLNPSKTELLIIPAGAVQFFQSEEWAASDLLGRVNDPLQCFPLSHCTAGVPHTYTVR